MENKGPLSDMRVIELTSYVAAPITGRILADWGADVIKVEGLTGDPSRWMALALSIDVRDSSGYDILSANKRSLALDTRSPKGMAVFNRLLSGADVLISNFREDALQKMGLAHEALAATYPRLIFAHMTGYGDTGPDAGRPGFDSIAYSARSGQSVDIVPPDSHPISPPMGMGDIPVGTILAGGICAAYVRQQRTGLGDKVSISLFGTGIWSNAIPIVSSQYGDQYPRERYKNLPIFTTYRCKDDRWLSLAGLVFDKNWPALCKALGVEELLEDERYASFQGVLQNSKDLIERFEGIFATRDSQEWARILTDVDLPFEKCLHYSEVSKDEQAWAAGYLHEATYPSGRRVALPRTPVQFKSEGLPPYESTAQIGEHSREVLTEAGFSQEEIQALIDDEVIGIP
jgi:crotonobetainyl-CoA:carnitine CoA-transferase CaiB-like acyl-CoA transferase